ncbi:hypothetical protein ACFVYR_31230 [Streptomyces sp. NPDC058284]|uniref:hypothetical protein n=1 Tax=unclassified Streptomyces TaxID=2593676 RepID=UPI00365F92B5
MSQSVPLASQSERVDRLRAQLAGEPAPDTAATADGATPTPRARRAARTARRLALSPAANLLYGMTLRAAARSEQNEKLTDLEEQLLGVLRVTGSSDAELAEFGRVFKEQATARGASALFTADVTERPLSEGFSFDDLAAVLPALAPEITAQPNFRTVRVDTLQPGQQLDTAEAAQARAEYGGGSIVFLSEENMSGFGSNPTPLTARVEFTKFYAQARAHDTVFDPKNEIYWCSGAGSDVSKVDFRSPVFSGVDSGHVRHFAAGANFFNGQIKNALTGNIQCWEHDDSGSGFFDDLREACRQIKEWAFKTSEALENQNEEYNGSSAFLSLVGLVAALINAILGWVRNDDDLLDEIDVAFSTAALHVMSKRPLDHNSLFFAGDGGKFYLYLKVVMPQGPAFPLRQHTLTGTTWSALSTPPGLASGSPAALESHGGKLHALFLAPGSTNLMHSILDGTTWSTPQRAWSQAGSIYASALASDGTKLHAVHTAGDGTLRYNWYTAAGWSATSTIHTGSFKTMAAPALAFHNGRLHLVVTGLDQQLYYTVYENGSWGSASALTYKYMDVIEIPAYTDSAPTAVSFKGALNVFYRDVAFTPGAVNRFILQGAQRTHLGTVATWRTRSGPAIEVFENKLHCVLPSLSGQLWHARFDANTNSWSNSTTFAGARSVDEPALATHAGKLHLLYR